MDLDTPYFKIIMEGTKFIWKFFHPNHTLLMTSSTYYSSIKTTTMGIVSAKGKCKSSTNIQITSIKCDEVNPLGELQPGSIQAVLMLTRGHDKELARSPLYKGFNKFSDAVKAHGYIVAGMPIAKTIK